MSKPITPTARPLNTLIDARSTGSAPRPRLPDVLGLHGTKKR